MYSVWRREREQFGRKKKWMKFQRRSDNIKRTTISATEVSEREEKVTRTGKKNWSNNGQNLPNLDEKHILRDSGNSMNSKQEEI